MNPNAHVVSFYIDMNDLFGELVFQMRNERDVSNAITTLYDPAVFPFRTNQANISVAELRVTLMLVCVAAVRTRGWRGSIVT